MSNLSITAADVAEVERIEAFTGPANETIVAGQYVRLNTSNGKTELGKGSSTAEARAGGIAINGGIAGEPITAIRKGLVNIGDAMSGDAYDADIHLSDTDGTLAQSAGSNPRIVGTVVPNFATALGSGGVADKLLRVNM